MCAIIAHMPPQEITSLAQLGARVAEARDAAGLSQTALADAVGLERSMVAKIEGGTRKVSAPNWSPSHSALVALLTGSSPSRRARLSAVVGARFRDMRHWMGH